MTNGDIAMELLAALGGFEVVRPEMQESTTLGSARLGAACCVRRWLGHHEARDAHRKNNQYQGCPKNVHIMLYLPSVAIDVL